jgi:putative transposase
VNRSKITEKETFDEQLQKIKPYDMGMQVSSDLDSEISEKGTIRSLRKYLGEIFRELALQRESEIIEGHLMGDHVHLLISIPPKYSVSQVVGYIKGKSAIHIARTYAGKRRNFTGQNFWARGYFVSTVGRDEETVKQYIKKQEDADRKIDQLELF